MRAAIKRDRLDELVRQCELDAIGAAPALPVPFDTARYAARVGGPLPPELAWLARSLPKRLDPTQVLPGVRSVIVALVSYAGPQPGIERLPPGHAFVSRFAWSRDYHRTVGARMKQLADLLAAGTGAAARWYVDTGPVVEKAYAAAAGLGFLGRNTLLVSPRLGSFVFLGVVLTDADVEATGPGPVGGCGTCRACVDACPTGALDGQGGLDPNRCLAHWNAGARTPVPAMVASRLGGNLYGCDLCQDACPWNARAERPDRPEFRPLPGLWMPPLDELARMDADGFERRFGVTPVRRRGLDLVKSTALQMLKSTKAL